ncbi:MAG: hypothetical protein ABS76_21525 [Pelagibacterium sp. SCN 64-44]|nr:MAG: hypothetical protein ABS76_21525 [Pelagibacterium sp. SCN 64-44]
MTDISRMLRERRELIEQEAVSKKAMPPDLHAKAESLVLQLWSAMQVETNRLITDHSEMATKRISQAEADAAEALTYADDLQGQIDSLQEKLQVMASELESLRDQNRELEKALATADSRLHEAQKRAAGLQHALNLTVQSHKRPGLHMPDVDRVSAEDVELIFGVIQQQLVEQVPVDEQDACLLPGLEEMQIEVVTQVVDALRDADLLHVNDEGHLELPALLQRKSTAA